MFWQIFGSLRQAKQRREAKRSKEEKQAKWRKQRTAAAVFFLTFGALPEVHFLHAIYHFKAQEVKNPTLQTVYDLELKWGRYSLWKITAPGLCEIRTTPWNSHNTFSLCEACVKLSQHSHNTFSLCKACAKLAQHSHNIRTAHAWCEFSFIPPTPCGIFSYVLFDVISFIILVTNQSQAFAFVKTI